VRRDDVPQDRLIASASVGSIQVFPRKPAVANLADVWRTGALQPGGSVEVRALRLEDYAAFRALHRHAEPWHEAPTLRQVESRRQVFAEGQLVAVCDGRVAGILGALVVPWDNDTQATRSVLTGEGYFTTHDPDAATLYVAEMLVEAGKRHVAVARALIQAGRRLCRRMNLRRMMNTVRLEQSAQGAPERYAMRVVTGDIADGPMRLRMSLGFDYCGILHGFMPEGAASGGHAALFAWLNPIYAPPRPPACAQSERPRKCA
jgi:GNAT superfamily N-acetyltransferase